MIIRRYKPAKRRQMILDAAVIVACRPAGWARLTREAIAVRAGCSEALVSRYLGDMKKVRRAIMKVAIKNDYQEIISASRAMHDGFVR